jgi:hypothetical protein
MAFRFEFDHDGKRRQVVGEYGTGLNQGFSVVTLVDGARRLLRAASSDVPSGVGVECFVTAASEAELVSQLLASYPGMTGFSAQ